MDIRRISIVASFLVLLSVIAIADSFNLDPAWSGNLTPTNSSATAPFYIFWDGAIDTVFIEGNWSTPVQNYTMSPGFANLNYSWIKATNTSILAFNDTCCYTYDSVLGTIANTWHHKENAKSGINKTLGNSTPEYFAAWVNNSEPFIYAGANWTCANDPEAPAGCQGADLLDWNFTV